MSGIENPPLASDELRVHADDRIEYGIQPIIGAAITLPVTLGVKPTSVAIYVVASGFSNVDQETVQLVRRVARLVVEKMRV